MNELIAVIRAFFFKNHVLVLKYCKLIDRLIYFIVQKFCELFYITGKGNDNRVSTTQGKKRLRKLL